MGDFLFALISTSQVPRGTVALLRLPSSSKLPKRLYSLYWSPRSGLPSAMHSAATTAPRVTVSPRSITSKDLSDTKDFTSAFSLTAWSSAFLKAETSPPILRTRRISSLLVLRMERTSAPEFALFASSYLFFFLFFHHYVGSSLSCESDPQSEKAEPSSPPLSAFLGYPLETQSAVSKGYPSFSSQGWIPASSEFPPRFIGCMSTFASRYVYYFSRWEHEICRLEWVHGVNAKLPGGRRFQGAALVGVQGAKPPPGGLGGGAPLLKTTTLKIENIIFHQ